MIRQWLVRSRRRGRPVTGRGAFSGGPGTAVSRRWGATSLATEIPPSRRHPPKTSNRAAPGGASPGVRCVGGLSRWGHLPGEALGDPAPLGIRGAPGPALPGADRLWLVAEFPALLEHRPSGAGGRAAPGPTLPGADPLWLVAQFPAPLRGDPRPYSSRRRGTAREGTVRECPRRNCANTRPT